MSSLHELYLVSGIICKSGVTEDAFSDEETRFEDVMKLKAPLSRIQRLMLALLPKYSVRENWDRVSYLVIFFCSIQTRFSLCTDCALRLQLASQFLTYRVYKKKVDPFKLSIAYCIILTALIASN